MAFLPNDGQATDAGVERVKNLKLVSKIQNLTRRDAADATANVRVVYTSWKVDVHVFYFSTKFDNSCVSSKCF